MKIHGTAVLFILLIPAILLPLFFRWGFYSLFIAHGQAQSLPMGLILCTAWPGHHPHLCQVNIPKDWRTSELWELSCWDAIASICSFVEYAYSIYILCLIEIEAPWGFASAPYEQQGVPTTAAGGRRKTLKENTLLYMQVPIALLKLVCICTGHQRMPSTGRIQPKSLPQQSWYQKIAAANYAESHT